MRVYVDSSALIKRAVEEAESGAVEAALSEYVDSGVPIVSSSLAWIEVSRALRARLDGSDHTESDINDVIAVALSGLAEYPIARDVVGLARRVAPPVLRTLDAIHLATAILLDADVVIAYDDRLTDACRRNGLATSAPGHSEAAKN